MVNLVCNICGFNWFPLCISAEVVCPKCETKNDFVMEMNYESNTSLAKKARTLLDLPK